MCFFVIVFAAMVSRRGRGTGRGTGTVCLCHIVKKYHASQRQTTFHEVEFDAVSIAMCFETGVIHSTECLFVVLTIFEK